MPSVDPGAWHCGGIALATCNATQLIYIILITELEFAKPIYTVATSNLDWNPNSFGSECSTYIVLNGGS